MFSGDHLLGWLSLLIIVIALSYSLFKRIKVKGIKRKTLLDCHCFLAIIATLFAFLHVGSRLGSVTFSISYICLFTMLFSTITGVILKYFGIKNIKIRLLIKRLHIGLTVVFVLTLITHIVVSIVRILIG